MTIQAECQCGKTYNTPDENAGRRFACKACGAEVVVPEGDGGDVAATLAWIHEQREAGHSRGALRSQLVEHGYDEEQATALVDAALGSPGDQTRMRRQRAAATGGDDGGVASWMIWLGILVGFNVLSYIFDWGWILW